MDREAWWAIVHGVTKSRIQLSDVQFFTLPIEHEVIYIIDCLSFPGSSDGKEFAYNAGDLGLIPGLRRSPGEGNDNPFQYPSLEDPKDSRAWWAIVHGVTKSWT